MQIGRGEEATSREAIEGGGRKKFGHPLRQSSRFGFYGCWLGKSREDLKRGFFCEEDRKG